MKYFVCVSMLVLFPALVVGQTEIPPMLEQPYVEEYTDVALPMPYISPENAKLGKKGKKSTDLAREWQDRPVLPTVEKMDGAVIFTYGVTQPVVVCKPLNVCVLRLEEAEKILDVHCGDIARWSVIPSAQNDKRAPHIVIKALDSGLTTNLAVITDKRTYIIELKSRNDKYTPLVSFRYPENEMQQWQAYYNERDRKEAEAKFSNHLKAGSLSFNAEALDFDYAIDGEARWKPLRVFNDGVKTYIQMSSAMKMYEAPVLLSINDGQEALVNYRLHDDLFIVDQIFDKALLISGVGSYQEKITITHQANSPISSSMEGQDNENS